MGLGLAIASAIAIAHGGRLGVERVAEGGTRVSLVVPRAEHRASA
jgi:signal transduction histidine kinase